jgi:branched-chain amino acid transport system permease protein
MSLTLLAIQTLNGLQFGLMLFLVAAGLTLVFGVMDFINLAHGVQYMLGAYLTAALTGLTGNFFAGLAFTLPGTLMLGLVLERLVFRPLYARNHLDQVLATFGVILAVNEGVKLVFGAAPISVPLPDLLKGAVEVYEGLLVPKIRLAIIGMGLVVALLLAVIIEATRFGMRVRAGATNAPMLMALGVDVGGLFRAVSGFGAMLAGFAGGLVAPLLSVEPGMGDTLGRSFATDLLRLVTHAGTATRIGPAIASMAIYLLMAGVLAFRPAGLFPARGAP